MDIYPFQQPVGPMQYPVESMELSGFLKGVAASKSLPSPAGAAADAVTSGIQSYDTQQQAQAALSLTQAKAQQEQMATQLMPLKVAAEASRIRSQALKDQILTKNLARQSDREELRLQDKSLIGGLFDNLYSTSDPNAFSRGLSVLEANQHRLANGGIDFNKEGEGTKVAPDMAILSQVNRLPDVAKQFAGADPSLVTRAQQIQRNFRSTIDTQALATSGKPSGNLGIEIPTPASDWDLLSGAPPGGGTAGGAGSMPPAANQQPAQDQSQGQTQGAAGFTPAADTGAQQGPPQAQTQATGQGTVAPGAQQGGVAGPTPPQASGTPAPQGAQTGYTPSTRPPIPDLNFPKDPFPPAPELSGEGPKSRYQEIIEGGSVPSDEALVARTALQLRRQFPTMTETDAVKEAQTQLSKNKLGDAELQQRELAATLAGQSREAALRLTKVIGRMQDFSKRFPEAFNTLGPTATLDQTITSLRSQAGFASADEKDWNDNVLAPLNAIGVNEVLQRIFNLKGSFQILRNPKALALHKQYFTGSDVSLAGNLEAAEVAIGTADQLNDRLKIVDTVTSLGHDMHTAQIYADRFEQANPPTVEGSIMGQPRERRNNYRPDVYQYLYQRLGGSTPSRDNNNRLISAPPPPGPTSMATQIAAEVQSGKLQKPNSSDIPAMLPDGATPDLVRGIIGQEDRSLSPTAVSSEGAQGVMQLMPATGKELWNKLGFDGEYNPNDVEKNIIMGTAYINQMLTKYKGNTALALAAYNAGPGNVDKAYKKALRTFGANPSWDDIKHFLPKLEETGPYVQNIMGTPQTLMAEKHQVAPDEAPSVIAAGINSARGQNNARVNLTPAGITALKDASQAQTVADAHQAGFGDVVEQLIGVPDAQAQEPGAQSKEASGGGSPSILDAAESTPLVGGAIKAARGLSQGDSGEAIQSFATGAARSLLWGWDDESAALLRSKSYGVPYDQALTEVRQIRDKFVQDHPNFYHAGEVWGGFAGLKEFQYAKAGLSAVGKGVSSILGLGAKAAPAVEAATEGAAAAGGEAAAGEAGTTIGDALKDAAPEEAKNIFERGIGLVGRAIKQGVTGGLIGGAAGAVQGAGEGEPGHRSFPATMSGITGLGVGTALGGTLSVASDLVTSPAVKSALLKAFDYLTGNERVQFEPAEAQVLYRLSKMTGPEVDAHLSKLRSSNNPAASFIDDVGEGNIKQIVDYIAKTPSLGAELQTVAGARQDAQASRIGQHLSQFGEVKQTATAATDAAQAVQQRLGELVQERRDVGMKSFEPLKASLPTQPTESPVGPDVELFGADNKAISSRPVTEAGVPTEVPVFQGKEIDRVLTNPIIADAVGQAQRDVAGFGNRTPRESFDVLQKAEDILDSQRSDAAGNDKLRYGQAQTMLNDALDSASGGQWGEANAKYKEASQNIEKFQSRGEEALRKFQDDKKVINVEQFNSKLFSMDENQVSNLMKSLPADAQQKVKDSALSYIYDQFEGRVPRGEGEGLAYPRKLLNGQSQKVIGAIFGNDAPKIIQGLTEEKGISSSSTIAKQGAQTFQRSAEDAAANKSNAGVVQGIIAAARGSIYSAAKSFASALSNNEPQEKVLQKVADIAYLNKGAAIRMFEKTSQAIKSHGDDKAIQAWNKLTEAVYERGILPKAAQVSGQKQAELQGENNRQVRKRNNTVD